MYQQTHPNEEGVSIFHFLSALVFALTNVSICVYISVMEASRQREEGELYFVLKDWGAIAKLKIYTHLLCIHISSVVFLSYFVSVGVCISEMEVHADYSRREFLP